MNVTLFLPWVTAKRRVPCRRIEQITKRQKKISPSRVNSDLSEDSRDKLLLKTFRNYVANKTKDMTKINYRWILEFGIQYTNASTLFLFNRPLGIQVKKFAAEFWEVFLPFDIA